jgi:hypothetical protein
MRISASRKDYRVYGYDGARRIVTSDWINASSDEEAIAQATALGFTKCELWLSDRLVAQLQDEHRAA